MKKNGRKSLCFWFAFLMVLSFLGESYVLKAETKIRINWLDKGYHEIGEYKEGLIPAAKFVKKQKKNKKQKTILRFGYLDKEGLRVIPFQYLEAKSFQEGLAPVKKKRKKAPKWGYIDKQNKEVIAFQFDEAGAFHEGFAVVGKRNKKGEMKYTFIDKTGKKLTKFEYDEIANFHEGFAAVAKKTEKDGLRYGMLNEKGEFLLPLEYEEVRSVSEGLVLARKNGLCGYLTKEGKEAISFVYSDGGEFREGLVPVQFGNGKWAVLNKEEDLVVKPKYDLISNYSEGLFMVKNFSNRGEPECGYVDKEERLVIPMDYRYGGDFLEEIAIVEAKGGLGYLHKSGRELLSTEYDFLSRFQDGVATVRKGKRVGILTKIE